MKIKGYFVSGIQQMGVGVYDLREAWEWYIRAFGMDCRIFEDVAEAKQACSTGHEPAERRGI